MDRYIDRYGEIEREEINRQVERDREKERKNDMAAKMNINYRKEKNIRTLIYYDGFKKKRICYFLFIE